MANVSNAVDQAAGILKERISELEGELGKLRRALGSLTDGREGRRGPGRPRSGGAGTGVAKRRRRGGTRAEHALTLIKDRPSISASEIARELGIKPNYMYRVLSDLQKDGRVKKSGRSYTAT